MAENFDLIVLGAGSAARDAAAKASREHGARVALVERTRWGGSCPNVACRPTKAYLVAAELAYTVNELSAWMGVDCGPARVDLARVRTWKDSLRRTQESWVQVLNEAGYELVQGEASFVDARAVRVGLFGNGNWIPKVHLRWRNFEFRTQCPPQQRMEPIS